MVLAENLQKFSFYRTLIGAILNVILIIILIPKYNIKGAAITTLISKIIAAYLCDLFSSKTRIMFFMKTKSLLLIRM